MPFQTAFLPQPAFHGRRTSQKPKLQASTPSPNLPRRTILQLIPLLITLPTSSTARTAKPLSDALMPLINLQTTLSTLSFEIENGTIADIRRVVKILLIGADVPTNLRDAASYLPMSEQQTVLDKGRQAYEYLNQVIEYYDSVDVKSRAGGEFMFFCLEAVKKADEGLVDVIDFFGEDGEILRRSLIADD